MPKINRIRIANVVWEERRITDEMFDTYDGENMLMNLENGGGKSVLVQMILQPMLPFCKIQDRSTDSYLSSTGSPTYIMIEWKLDSEGVQYYLLTGIVMCRQAADDAEKIRSFTFTNYYSEANAYDIEHIPFITHNGREISYMPYSAALKTLKKANDRKARIQTFAKDESQNYSKHLRENGIIPEEWKLLHNVNNEEGGIDKIFSKCKDSDSLMDRWILKTVSGPLLQSRTELQELFKNLMTEILSKEEKLKEKEILEKIIAEADDFAVKTSDLCSELDKAEQSKKKLLSYFAALEQQCAKLERQKEELVQQQGDCQSRLSQIDKEEASEDFINKQKDFDEANSAYQSALETAKEAKQKSSDADRRIRCLEAAEHDAKIKELKSTAAFLTAQLSTLKSNSSNDENARVIYTLWTLYNKEISKFTDQITELRQKAENLSNQKIKNQEIKNSLENQNKINVSEQNDLKVKIKIFNNYEQKVLEKLSVWLMRSLSGDLPQAEVDAAQKELQNAFEKQASLFDSLCKKETDNQTQAENIHAKIKENENEKGNAENQQREIAAQTEKYKKAVEERLEIIKNNQLKTSLLFKNEELQKSLYRLLENFQQESERFQRRKIAAEEILHDCKTNNMHTARRFGEMLNKFGIQYDTGEHYLSAQPAVQREKLLQANPMLPFCFLVGEEDIKKVNTVAADEPLNRICPVISYDDICVPFGADGNAVKVGKMQFMCFYNHEIMQSESREKYAQELQGKIDDYAHQLDNLKSAQNQIVRDINVLKSDFPYTEKSEEKLKEESLKTEKMIQQLSEQSAQLEKEQKENIECSKKLIGEKKSAEQNVQQAENNLKEFKEYLQKNEQFLSEKKREAQVSKEIISNSEKISSLEKGRDALIDELSETKQRIKGKDSELSETEKGCAELGNPQKTELLPGSFQNLKERYEEIHSQMQQTEKELTSRLSKTKESEKEEEEKIRRYSDLRPEEYEGLDTSNEAFAKAEQQKKEANVKSEAAVKNEGEKSGDFNTAKRFLKESEKNLKKYGLSEPLLPEQILGQYEQRRDTIKAQQKSLMQEQEKCRRHAADAEEKKNNIRRFVNTEKSSGQEKPVQTVPELSEIDALGEQFKSMQKSSEEHYRSLQYQLKDLNNQYGKKDDRIQKYFQSLSFDSETHSYDNCYFIYEHMTEQTKKLKEILSIIQTNLNELNDRKKNIVMQALIQGKEIYKGLQNLSSWSKVKLWPEKAPCQTLRIDVPEVLDGSEENRMTEYVNDCIKELRREKSSTGMTDELLRKRVDACFQDRALLSKVINRNSVPVYLYKVDRVPQNSKMRKWEEVEVENSGGEAFVSCFILLSALMDYRRRSFLQGVNIKKSTRVMLVDNPFGKASSKHLVDAMLKTAGKYNTQMICLSQINQSSITNRSALICQLSVRQALYGGKSYLKTREVIKNGSPQRNESLEHMVLSTKPEQMSLFGE